MEKELQLLPLVYQTLQKHKKICTDRGLFFKVTSTYRSSEEQTAFYNQPFDGKDNDGDGLVDERDEKITNAKAGQSFHNWKVAYDVAPLVDGAVVYDEAILAAIGYYGKQIGLTWGGDFKNFPDKPHFQLTLGYTFQDFIDGKVDYSRFGVKTAPDVVTTITKEAVDLLESARAFQVSENILDFANQSDPSKIIIGKKTLAALRKYQTA